MSERIGWLGLGDLGLPMATNLLENGYELLVYNRTRTKAEPLVKRGAQLVNTPSEVATAGGVVVSVLWNSDVTEELVSREFLDRLQGGVHIGMCTGSPDAARKLSKLHAEHGSAYVEATVFGRPAAARARLLSIPYIGSPKAKDRAKAILTALGGHGLFDMGSQAGVPTVIKQLGNFLIISMGRSLEEGLAVASAAGVDQKAAVDMLSESLFPVPLFRNYGKAIAAGESLLANSAIPAKDLGLFCRLAEEHSTVTPFARLLHDLTLTATA